MGDKGCFKRAKELIEGKIKSERSDLKQKELAAEVNIKNGVAVVSDGAKIAAHIFNQGAKVLIRESEVGHSIMISKEMSRKGIKLSELSTSRAKGLVHPSRGFSRLLWKCQSPEGLLSQDLPSKRLNPLSRLGSCLISSRAASRYSDPDENHTNFS